MPKRCESSGATACGFRDRELDIEPALRVEIQISIALHPSRPRPQSGRVLGLTRLTTGRACSLRGKQQQRE